MSSQITSSLVRDIAEKMGLKQGEAKFAAEYLRYYYEPDKKKVLTSNDITKHTKDFQKMFGLTANGKLDGQTRTAMKYPRCGCPDFMMISKNRQAAKWGKKNLTYYIDKYVSRIPKSDQDDLLDLGFKQWEEHANLDIKRTNSKSSANLILSTGRGRRDNFDGPSGTLAWAYLPPNNSYKGQLLMRFDLDETWIVNSRDRGILFLNVACHEFGHMLGLHHSRVQRALMAPYYSPGITKPQFNDDVSRIQRLYGKADPTPEVPPEEPGDKPAPPKPGMNKIEISGINHLSQVKINGKAVEDFTLI